MFTRYVDDFIQRIPGLKSYAERSSRTLHELILGGGTPVRKAVDMLHGTWLGHPVHPIMTDFVIGAWGIGALTDVLALSRNDHQLQKIGDLLAEVGTCAAIPTIATGLADFSAVKKPAAPTTVVHAALNGVNVALYLMSIRERRRGRHGRGISLSLLGMGLATASAWLGGHLVYNLKVGVDHSEATGPEEWTTTVSSFDVPDGRPVKTDVAGNPVLLFRFNGTVYGIDATCNHAGGPLEEGRIDGCFVQCPWHDSVFDLRDGSIKHGPATRPQAAFDVRERDGKVEVRLASANV